jgi:hypothetical protein
MSKGELAMLHRALRRPRHSTVVAYLALLVAMSGTAFAATGGTMLLGKGNGATHTTSLVNHGQGAALRLSAHTLTTPPLSVGRNHAKIRNLNADFLDGLTSAKLQRRVSGACGHGSAIRTVKAGGRVACGPRLMWAVVNADGTLARSTAGVASSRSTTGQYAVTFPINVTNCAHLSGDGTAGNAGAAPVAIVGTSGLNSNAKGVFIATYSESNSSFGLNDAAFHLVVVC